ncbi:MAG: hypothetical protein Q4D53_00965 [Leptotrichiaceae bacterium]|nr:hypothetical protein [Leptotrichiaceae bacterium]
MENDYEGYFEKEMEIRKLLNYPPYGRLIIAILSSDDEKELEGKVKLFYNKISDMAKTKIRFQKNEFISEPFKAPIYKINGRFRYQIFIKFNRNNITKIKNIIKAVLNDYKEKNIRVSIDVDPVSML